MARQMYLAMVKTPLGVWEETATVCEGHEAEFRARKGAKVKFLTVSGLPPFMRKSTEYLVDTWWRTAQDNGCEMIVRELTLDEG